MDTYLEKHLISQVEQPGFGATGCSFGSTGAAEPRKMERVSTGDGKNGLHQSVGGNNGKNRDAMLLDSGQELPSASVGRKTAVPFKLRFGVDGFAKSSLISNTPPPSTDTAIPKNRD